MNKEEITRAIGEMLIKEKYKFLPNGLIGEIVRDFVSEIEKFGISTQSVKGFSKEKTDELNREIDIERRKNNTHEDNKNLMDKDYSITTQNELTKEMQKDYSKGKDGVTK